MSCSRILVLLTASAHFALVLTVAPPATAQSTLHLQPYVMEIHVQPVEGSVAPIREIGHADIRVTVSCLGPLSDTYLGPQSVEYVLQTDRHWATVTSQKSSSTFMFQPHECVNGAVWEDSFVAEVRFAHDAPAFEHATFEVQAHLSTGEHTDTEWTQRVGFYERWQARFDRSHFVAGPDERVTIPLVVENFGNGPIQVRVLADEGTSDSIVVALPAFQIVPSLIAGGETDRVELPIDIKTPHHASQDRLVLRVEGSSADDTSETLAPIQLAAYVETDGSIADPVEELPAIGPVTTMLGLLGAAALRRRL